MKINDEVDLANVLGMAFAGYANRVQNGNVAPYTGFLKGDNAVTVTIYLNGDGSITVMPAAAVITTQEAIMEAPVESTPEIEETATTKKTRTKTT